MSNPLKDFFSKQFVSPLVEEQTRDLRKELNRTKSALEKKNFDLLTAFPGRSGFTAFNKRQLLDQYVSWAFANITAIAEAVADINWKLYKLKRGKSEEELDEVTEHPVLDLLYRVNDHTTKWDLVFTWVVNMLSMGEAAWYLVGRKSPTTEPTEIWSIRPDYLKIIPGDLANNEFVARYEYQIPGQKTVTFAPWEILFFKYPHPTNAYRGYGVLEAASRDIEIDLYANEYNRRFFLNNARPDSVLTTPNKLSEEVVDRLMKMWRSKYGGPENAGSTAVLESGLDVKLLGQTAKDMEFFNQQQWTRDKLMAMFRNTKSILGIVEDVNRSNAEASQYTWTKHNIKPKMQRLTDFLNEFLVPAYGVDLFLSFEDPVPESAEVKLAEYEKGVDRWITRNEIRMREGLDPVEGGDSLYLPFTEQPIDSPMEEPMNDQGDTPKGLVKMKVHTGKGKVLFKKYSGEVRMLRNRIAAHERLAKKVEGVVERAYAAYERYAMKDFENGQVTKEMQQKRWENFVKVAGIFEANASKLIEIIIRHHEEKTVSLIGRNYTPVKSLKKRTKAVNDLLPNDKEYVKLSIEALRPLLEALALEEGKDTFTFLGIQQTYVPSKQLLKIIDKFALEASESYVGTLRERIKDALVEGVSLGEGVEKLQRRIREKYDQLTPSTARKVARTETIRAANAATEDGFKESNVVTGKQWFTALDERVDDECAALDGKIVELDGDFSTLDDVPKIYENVGYPPLHPNCRCTLSPVIVNKSSTPRKTKKKESKDVDFSALVQSKIDEAKIDIENKLAAEIKNLAKEIAGE